MPLGKEGTSHRDQNHHSTLLIVYLKVSTCEDPDDWMRPISHNLLSSSDTADDNATDQPTDDETPKQPAAKASWSSQCSSSQCRSVHLCSVHPPSVHLRNVHLPSVHPPSDLEELAAVPLTAFRKSLAADTTEDLVPLRRIRAN